jgi:hypothetical protein
MNNLLQLIDKYKFGILAVLITYIGIFMYLQLSSFEKKFVIQGWFHDRPSLEKEEQIEIKPENIEMPSTSTQAPKNIARDVNDKREKSMQDWTEATPSKTTAKDIEKSVKELEKQFFKEAGGEEKRKKIIEESKAKLATKTDSKSGKKEPIQKSGGDKAYAGNVMVDWILSNRTPHQNDPYFVRNPGYTCGDRTSGLVTIKIKVDQSGRVISSTYVASSSNGASVCMIEQAKKYALMSRFNYSNSSPSLQEGTIRYTFVSQ